jgi:hypothetical protein
MRHTMRYTLLLDDVAAKHTERLAATYGLKNKADVYDLAIRVLTWVTEQHIDGYEVGRFKDAAFQPLLITYKPNAAEYAKDRT